jgi:hypothetical protein
MSDLQVCYKYGFEATFADGQTRRGVAFNASTAKVEIAFLRLREGGCTSRELEVVDLQRVKELDIAPA